MAIRDIARRKLTYDDYLRFPDDGLRHELLDGEHFVTNAPSRWHQTAVSNLNYFLVEFLRRTSLGRVFPAPFEVFFDRYHVALPDLVFVSNERLDILTDKNIQGAPDLIIEVLSSSTRRADEVVKRGTYERFGVLEYWIVDPRGQTVQVFRAAESGFTVPNILAAEDLLTTPLLPGLEIPVREIFR